MVQNPEIKQHLVRYRFMFQLCQLDVALAEMTFIQLEIKKSTPKKVSHMSVLQKLLAYHEKKLSEDHLPHQVVKLIPKLLESLQHSLRSWLAVALQEYNQIEIYEENFVLIETIDSVLKKWSHLSSSLDSHAFDYDFFNAHFFHLAKALETVAQAQNPFSCPVINSVLQNQFASLLEAFQAMAAEERNQMVKLGKRPMVFRSEKLQELFSQFIKLGSSIDVHNGSPLRLIPFELFP